MNEDSGVSVLAHLLLRYNFGFEYLNEVDSTSDYIKRKIKNDTPAFPFGVVAKTQTAGRGRLTNRGFFSPGGGLYFSCAFLPGQIRCRSELITLAAGVAVAHAVEHLCGCDVKLKWVNDVLVGGKKVCGILSESVYCESIKSVVYVIGIGVNTDKDALDGFMPEKVGALPKKVDLTRLMGEIAYNMLAAFGDESGSFINDYNKRLTVADKRVQISNGKDTFTATVIGASADGLVCRKDNGEVYTVRTCDEIVTDMYADARGE